MSKLKGLDESRENECGVDVMEDGEGENLQGRRRRLPVCNETGVWGPCLPIGFSVLFEWVRSGTIRRGPTTGGPGYCIVM